MSKFRAREFKQVSEAVRIHFHKVWSEFDGLVPKYDLKLEKHNDKKAASIDIYLLFSGLLFVLPLEPMFFTLDFEVDIHLAVHP